MSDIKIWIRWLIQVNLWSVFTSFVRRVIMKEFNYNEILPGLFQSGSFDDPKKVIDLKIDVVIDLEGSFDPFVTPLSSYLYWPISDKPELPDVDELKAVASYGLACWKKKPQPLRVLVHCAQGMNRSGLLNGIILILSGMKGKDAVKLIREKRPGALVNFVFAEYLESL